MNLSERMNRILAHLKRVSALPQLFNKWLPLLVLAAALCVTGLSWKKAQHQVDRELQAEFDFSVQKTVRDIELRMETYRLLLHGLQGLFAASNYVSRDEFQTYVKTLDLKSIYPGIQGLGYSMIVPIANVASHQAEVRKSGFPHYSIKPSGNRDLITSIIYIEPFSEQNRRAFGYDMYSDSVHRTAMDRARALNKAALSGKIVLQQESSQDIQPGFVMYLPIHNPQSDSSPPASVVGWVHAQFRADDMMSALSTSYKTKIDFAVYDGDQISAQSYLFGTVYSNAMRSSQKRMVTSTRQIEIAGHVWTLEAHSLPELEARFDHSQPEIILTAGIISSLLLGILMQLLVHGRAHALHIAKEMNSALIKSEYRWKFALEGAGEGVWDWDIKTGYMLKSKRLKEALGYTEQEYANTYEMWQENLHPDDRQPVMDALNAYLEGTSEEFSVEERLRCKDGSWKWFLMRGMIVSRDKGGHPLRMIGTHADITERHKIDESLRLSATALNTVNEAVLVTDEKNCIVSVNPSFTSITGYTLEDVKGKNPSVLSDGTTRREHIDAMWKALKENDKWYGEFVNRRKNGELYIAWHSISCVRNNKGQLTNHVSVFSDISERKATEQRMQYLALFDPLTDLPNRALFTDRLRQALAINRRNRKRLGLLFIDLDKFKPVNDTLGHSFGDMLLKEVAYRLLDNIRESDTAGRIGGDEFVVLLPGIETEQDAIIVANKILEAINQPFQLDEHKVQISASIGIAMHPEHGQSDEEMLTNADNAMYHAKHNGGASIASFSQLQPKST